MALTLESPPVESFVAVDPLDPTVLDHAEVDQKPNDVFEETKRNVAEGIIKAVKGTMSPEEKLYLGMEMSALQGLLELRAVSSLEPATVSGDGVTEGQAEEATVDMVMQVMAEIVADVYTEQSGTITGRVLEMFRKSKVHNHLGRFALGGVAGASAMAVTVMSAPVAVPAVIIGTSFRAVTGKLREGLDKKVNKLPVDKVQEINKKLESSKGSEEEKEAYRSLLVANLLLEPLKNKLIESAHITHLDPEAGVQQVHHHQLAKDLSLTSTNYCLNLFGLSDVGKHSAKA